MEKEVKLKPKLMSVKGEFYVTSRKQLLEDCKDPVKLKQIEQQINSRGLLIVEE